MNPERGEGLRRGERSERVATAADVGMVAEAAAHLSGVAEQGPGRGVARAP